MAKLKLKLKRKMRKTETKLKLKNNWKTKTKTKKYIKTKITLRRYTTALNADVPNCHTTLKVVIYYNL